MPFRVGFCVSGGGRLFQQAVRHAAQLAIDPAAVFAAPRTKPLLDAFCREHGVPLCIIEEPDRRAFDSRLTRITADAGLDLVVLTFNRIVPPEMVARYRGRIINMHPGLLPGFRGPHPLDDALEIGARFLGATMHEVDELTDHGPIIAQCVLPGLRGETVQEAASRLYRPTERMFLQTLAWFAEGRVEKDEEGRIWIRGARYGTLPVNPKVERSFEASRSA